MQIILQCWQPSSPTIMTRKPHFIVWIYINANCTDCRTHLYGLYTFTTIHNHVNRTAMIFLIGRKVWRLFLLGLCDNSWKNIQENLQIAFIFVDIFCWKQQIFKIKENLHLSISNDSKISAWPTRIVVWHCAKYCQLIYAILTWDSKLYNEVDEEKIYRLWI